LVSVAVGLGLAVVYFAVFFWFQHLVVKLPAGLQPALMIAGMVLRLGLAAAALIPLGVYTDLNIIAIAVAFVGLYTVLSGYGIYRAVAKAKREESQSGPGAEGGVVGG
jgi:uncharacterized membrane protein